MTENTNSEKVDLFQRQKNKEEMKKQVVSFALMIFLTLISFGLVATGSVAKIYAIPILLIMALVQVAFQFFYFMHLKDKGHEMPSILIYGGFFAAFLTLMAMTIITWW